MVQPVRSALVAGKYELLEEIGRGGMGAIWRARARHLDKDCALKMVLPHHESGSGNHLRLFKEARSAAKLRSPYVVTIYDVGQWEGSEFIAMELLEGESLKRRLARERVLPTADLLEMVRQIALGLDKAHAAGLVHRDLKPDNIFIVQREPLLAKILDFGIAKDLSVTGSTVTGAITGTPQYMSPEQANGGANVGFRADLWSLALICFECLTGSPPFTGTTLPQLLLNIVSGPIPVPSTMRAALPAEFDAWWARAASRDPMRRPQSALALSEGLRAAFLQAPNSRAEVVLSDEVSGTTRERARRVRRFAIAASVCASLAAGGYALYLMQLAEAASTDPNPALAASATVAEREVTQSAPRPLESPVGFQTEGPERSSSKSGTPESAGLDKLAPDPLRPEAVSEAMMGAVEPSIPAKAAVPGAVSGIPRAQRVVAKPPSFGPSGAAAKRSGPSAPFDEQLGF